MALLLGAGSALADDSGGGSASTAVTASSDDSADPTAGPDSSVATDVAAAGPDGAAAPDGQVKVIVTSPDGPSAAAAAVTQAGGTVDATLSLVGGVTADVPSAALPQLAASTSVQAVSNDATLSLTPNDGNVTPADDDGTETTAAIASAIGATKAYAKGIDGTGVDVAVLDTGIVPVTGLTGSHVVLGADLSTDADSPLRNLDGFGHGTAMAGIIGSNATGDQRGIAPGARLVSVKVGAADGSVDVSQVIAGIDWVVQHKDDNGVHIRVLNISFGSESLQATDLDPLAYAADVAWRHGIVVVTSVGNDGRADHRISDPAAASSVIAVGAADLHTGTAGAAPSVAPFSSLGNRWRHADLLAPGTHVLGLRDPGSTLDQAFPAARRGNAGFRGSGTSHAAAVVSGAVALLLQARPSLTPDQVKAILLKTTSKVSAPYTVAGAGLIDIGSALTRKVPGGIDVPAALHGTGSLEAARGSVHVLRDGVPVVGEVTVLGVPWSGPAWAAASAAGSTWQGSTWQGSTWQGSTWQGSTWQGSTWQGSTWQGSTWQGSTWQGSTWQGSTWQGSTWQGSSWQGSTWQGNGWSGSTWT